MKKILLSCACCLLAVGLLAGCDTEEEVVTPDEPDTSVPSTGGDDGDGGGEPGETIYKLGALDTTTYEYVYFSGEASGNFLGVTSSWDEAAPVTFEEVTSSEEGFIAVSISFVDAEGATKYISWSDNTKVDISDEPYAWYWVEENTVFAAGLSTGRALVYYEKDPSFRAYAQNESNLANSHVRVYTTVPETPEAPKAPEPTGTMEVVGTGVLGLLQENLGAYYYFTGELDSNNRGVITTDYSEAAAVTEWKDDAYYYLTIGENSSLKYIGCADTSAGRVSLSEEPYCLLVDETSGAFVTGDGKRFLGTYSTYDTLSWSEVSYLGNEGQFIATIYSEEKSLPAPTTLTVTGLSEVYVGYSIDLTVTVDSGADARVSWSWVPAESSNGVVTVEGGKVTGVTAGEVVVTATSTLAPSVSDSITITVLDVPTEFPYEDGESYWFGYEYNESLYSFTGAIVSSNYGGVATETNSAVSVVLNEVDDGYTLSFKDSATRSTQYIGIDSSNHFSISSEATVFEYNAVYDTFTYDVSSGDGSKTTYFIGNYYGSGTNYDELRVSEIGYLDGTKSSSNTQYAAHLYAQETPSAIAITGADSVSAGETLTLGITTEDKASHDVSWSITSGEEYATIDEYGVLTATSAGSVTVSAVSVKNSSVTATKEIEVVAEGSIVTTEITANYIVENFARENTDGKGTSYVLGADNSNNYASDAQKSADSDKTNVIGGVTMDFGLFDVDWLSGSTATKLWLSTSNVGQIRIYHNSTGEGGGLKITPHEGYEITSFYLYDSDGKLSNTSLSIINEDATTTLTSGTDYNITGSNKYIETVEDFSTQYTLQFMNTATGSNRIDAESIKITCAKIS